MNKFKNVEKLLKLNFKKKSKELSSLIQKSNIILTNNSKTQISITKQKNPNSKLYGKTSTKSFSTNNQNKNPESNSQSNSENTNSFSNNNQKEINQSETSSISNSNNENLDKTNLNSITEKDQTNDTLNNKQQNTNLISQNLTTEKASSDLTPIDREALKQTTMKKLNEHIPLEKISDEVLREMITHRVFEDSVAETVEKIAKEVPEISEHLKFRNYINEIIENDLQDELKNKEGLIILKKKSDPLIKYGMDYHHYRNFADRDYKVDVKETLEKDLFEKQRVVDSYVEENKQKINEILGYYENRIKFTKFNKFSYLIFQNNYFSKMNKIRISFLKQIGFAGFLSAALALKNPLFCLVLVPEYISIAYAMFMLNRTVDQVILVENKHSVKIRNLNFLGFRREIPGGAYEVSQIRYLGKFENNVLNLGDKGFSFATRLLWRVIKGFKKNEKNDKNVNNSNSNSTNSASDSDNLSKEAKSNSTEKKKNIYNKENQTENLNNSNSNNNINNNNNNSNKNSSNANFKNENLNESKTNKNNKKAILDNFQSFHMITANGDIFYLPADSSYQHADTNEELLLAILNNNYKKVLEFNYSEYEDRSTQFYEMVENWKKEYAKKSHDEYFTKEEILQREYSKYIGNRDYAEKITAVTLKRVDGLDGTFVDNGYR